MNRSCLWLRVGWRVLWLAAAWLLSTTASAQGKECAVVVVHGKWGNPQYIAFFGRKLRPTCEFESIEMPWSQRRDYDSDYPAALGEIDKQVQAFRSDGYRRVFIAGHSFGANAALAYMAAIGKVDGVILLAPGHVPDLWYERGVTREGVDKARQLVAQGKGAETISALDINQGQRRSLRIKASVYLSYFDPDSLGSMPASAKRFKQTVPVLWVVGTGDSMHARGTAYVFDHLQPHPASRYLEVPADHSSTPDVAAEAVRGWLAALP